MSRQQAQKQLRRAGYFDAGQLQALSSDGSAVNTSGRDHARSGVSLAPSDSSDVGNDNLFLVGAEDSLPAHAGLWPFIV